MENRRKRLTYLSLDISFFRKCFLFINLEKLISMFHKSITVMSLNTWAGRDTWIY